MFYITLEVDTDEPQRRDEDAEGEPEDASEDEAIDDFLTEFKESGRKPEHLALVLARECGVCWIGLIYVEVQIVFLKHEILYLLDWSNFVWECRLYFRNTVACISFLNIFFFFIFRI